MILLKITFDMLLSNIIWKLIILELLCKQYIKNLSTKLLKKQKLLWFEIYIWKLQKEIKLILEKLEKLYNKQKY